MRIQFSITVADDRIEIARGACIFALDRSTAVHQDYEAAAGMAVASGFGVASAFIVSLSPSHAAMATALVDAMEAPVMEETPLEAAIRRAEARAAEEDKVTDSQLYDEMMAKIDRERLAGQARAQREQMGASQADAGSAVGVPQSYISRMERNDPSMSTKAAVTLAKRVISHYSAAANEKPLPPPVRQGPASGAEGKAPVERPAGRRGGAGPQLHPQDRARSVSGGTARDG